MSDGILQALMQLFAIIANTDEVGVAGREIVERFLRRQLSSGFVAHYITVYDQFLDKLKGKSEEGKTRKRTSVNSVKVLRICTEINRELEQKQKLIVLIRLFEFVNSATNNITAQHEEFLNTVAETFTISNEERDSCRALVDGASAISETLAPNFLIVDKMASNDGRVRHIQRESLQGRLVFLSFREQHLFVFTYRGADAVVCDGRAVIPNSVHVFETGSVVRGAKLAPIYFNEIIHSFTGHNVSERVVFSVKELGYRFRNNKIALHDLSFSTASKNLVGVMGNSGAGKTTLLNLLNGSAKPTKGEILINGTELYRNKATLTGLIGNIPQDDLLIEELSVFQNLFYSSKLYFGSLSDEQITVKVNNCLRSLQLYEIRDLLVGDPLNKYISGGQRKRLNIALELIREPEILFVDEPTSGLSSNDAENVMDLLKQLILAGKLIFVVIHQPSSEIFKLFDQLLVLDTGGYPVYFGNPIDSVRYFKQQMHYVDYENSECAECGNINPEEIFRIMEAKTVDEFGRITGQRKIKSEEWFQLYNDHFVAKKSEASIQAASEAAKAPLISHPVVQYLVYLKRNLLAKLNNRQYLAITLIEGPLLALILSIALRAHPNGQPYRFGTNSNIPVYMFICTIVSLFLGLMASAEEIIQDKKILKRESFLRLSRQSYLLSKLSYLFLVSAAQALLFHLVGYFVLGFPGLFFHYFLVLFSVSCFGNVLGLNISSGMKTRVAVYILIPFLIIPQIMLSGVMVRFEDLSPAVTSQARVPLIGNIMATRWAYEALATDQFRNNPYEASFFYVDKAKSNAEYRVYRWGNLMDGQLAKMDAMKDANGDSLMSMKAFFRGEFATVQSDYPKLHLESLPMDLPKFAFIAVARKNEGTINQFFTDELTRAQEHRERLRASKLAAFGGELSFSDEKKCTHNESLEDMVLNRAGKTQLLIADNQVVRKFEPVFVESRGLLCAPFYASAKSLFGKPMETIYANVIVIWLMTGVLYITLYFDLLKKALERKR